MHKCKVKDCNFHNDSRRSFIYHIKNTHKINLEEYYKLYENKKPPVCIICNYRLSSWDNRLCNYRKVCSDKICICKYANTISKKSIKEKYNVDNIGQIPSVKIKVANTKEKRYGSSTYNNQEKNKETCLRKYNVTNGSKTLEARNKISEKYKGSNKKERIEKTIKTNTIKYGVNWNSQSQVVKDNKTQTYIKNWGTTHPLKSKDFLEKRKKIFKEKYGVEYLSQLPSFKEKISNTNFIKRKNSLLEKFSDIIVDFPDKNTVIIKCPICHNESILNIGFLLQRAKFGMDLCLTCTPYKIPSYVQLELSNWIKDFGIETINNFKIPGSNKEIDIYIPSKKIGFEYNGIYWHCDKFTDKNYHKDKKMLGIDAGINIVNIWEDDYIIKKNLIENKIKNVLQLNNISIGARKCFLETVNRNVAKVFLDENHIQGFIESKIYLGLYYNDDLVSLISFGRRNGLKEKEYEIFRFSSKLGYNVQGGFSKLLSEFKKQYSPSKIVTYVDLDWCNYKDNLYEKSGFIFIKETDPSYTYIIHGKRESRQKFQKHKLVKDGFDPNKTESQIMADRGFNKIYNCGNLKYEWNKKKEDFKLVQKT